MKFFIKIIDPEHSELIQNKLFELGFLWQKEPRNVIRNKNAKYIFIPTVGFSLSYANQVFPSYTEYKIGRAHV